MRDAVNIKDLNIENTFYDIVIVAGQSNAKGYGRSVSTNIFPFYAKNSNIKMLSRTIDTSYPEREITIGEKYFYEDAKPWSKGRYYGFFLYFGKLYKRAILERGRKLLILQTAAGGTSFSKNHWGKGEILSENSIDMAETVLKLNPKNKIVAVLWHQGESDTEENISEEMYYEKLKELVENYRERLNIPDLLFVFGDMQQDWKKTQPGSINISNATKRVATELIKAEYVVSDGLKGNSNGDMIHFNKKSQIELGKRYFSKFTATEKVKILFLGDSITQNGQFISIISTYLGIKGEDKNVELFNLGVSGENISGLTEKGHPYPRPYLFNRFTDAINEVTPDVVFVMYGVNDAIYRPFSEENFALYKEGIFRIVEELKARKVEPVICTPTIFDFPSCTSPVAENAAECQYGFIYKEYDYVMKKYSEWILTEVSKQCVTIDIRSAIINFISSKRKLDNSYSSGDGIHLNYDVNVAIAVAILRGYFGSDISVTRLAESGEFRRLFKFMYNRDTILHKYLKEKVGHDLPYKDNPGSYKSVIKKYAIANYHFHNTVKFFCSDPLLEKKYKKLIQKLKETKAIERKAQKTENEIQKNTDDSEDNAQ